MDRPLVAIAGFQHETNSFSPVHAALHSFIEPTNWPGLTKGADVLEGFAGLNISIGGFIDAAPRYGFDLSPILWANATPSGPLTKEAFETIAGMIVEGLCRSPRPDGIYLDLHGAMIAEGYLDGEGELLRRIRVALGPDIPLVVSLDLHANISDEMVELSDALIACRTYPHVDLAETGRRSARVLSDLLRTEKRTRKVFWKADFLIPTQAQTTLCEPARGLYAEGERIERELNLLDLSLAMGFGLSDTPAAGPTICATAFEDEPAEEAVRHLSALFVDAAPRFFQPTYSPDVAIERALRVSTPGRPAVLADLQDNPGAGGTGDTTGLLEALARAGVKASVLAVLYDPPAAAKAHAAGKGVTLTFSLGGHVGGAGSVPYRTTARVEALAKGTFAGTGPMYGSGPMNFGAMALLRLPEGPGVIVGSVNGQAADCSILHRVGVVPEEQDIICLKSGVHFRAAFEPIASEIVVVESPGSNPADYTKLAFKHLRNGVRSMPPGR